MHEAPPQTRRLLTFGEFLRALFKSLENEGIGTCVLRNYEGFPSVNAGGDVDLLLRPSELQRAIGAIRSIAGVHIVGYTERPYVASCYLEGISAVPGGHSLQVDFVLILGWKGLAYLPIETLLTAAIPRCAGDLNFFVPNPVHEAITSLFGRLLVAGMLKEKYFANVRRAFSENRLAAIASLQPQFGASIATKLVEAVIDGDRRKVMRCVWPLRVSLVLRKVFREPFGTIAAVCRHYRTEFAIRFSSRSLESVNILGSERFDKAQLIENLVPLCASSAKVIEKHELMGQFNPTRGPGESMPSVGSRFEAPMTLTASIGSIIGSLAGEWRRIYFGRLNLTLCLCNYSCYETLTMSQKSRYRGPIWLAGVIGRLLPSADLWIQIDNPGAAKIPRPGGEIVVLDAGMPASEMTEAAYSAIMNMLAERTQQQLQRRFPQMGSTN
jgi:hypothetical protein